jgi:16S rRNA (guanine966-N2)-methyltransferase
MELTGKKMLRITAGELRGRNIKTIVGAGYRPAMAKVREALFSMLEARGINWASCRALDLFAGSGSLGFEALSRGAKEVTFVEYMPKAAGLIGENAARLGIEPGRAHILAVEAGRVLNRTPARPFEVIFIDPPYRQNLLAPCLKAILRKNWLAPSGVVNAEVEAATKYDPEKDFPELTVIADRSYGQTRVLLWAMPEK